MSVAFLFPGQGSQVAGMLHTLPDHPAITQTFDEVSQYLGENVLDLDSPSALQSTLSVQLALFTCAAAMSRVLVEEGVRPAAVAGLSVGAFAAAVQSGTISLSDGVQLVRQRAEMMMKLCPKGYGLAAIVGLTERQVTALVDEVHARQIPIYIANVNAPCQIVIAGSNEGIIQVLRAAQKSGARKAELLQVSVPSHCPLLEPVAEALRESLQTMTLQPPSVIYVSNVNARPLRSAEGIAADFASNIAHSVRWHDATTVLEELGCRLFLELPPGRVLTELAREAFPDVRAVAVSETSLKYILRLVAQVEIT
jgi:malonate decarboxylase epsilon subunit